MKVAIVFYSYSGNTRAAGRFLKEKLENTGNFAHLVDLKLQREVKSFFKQCAQAALRKSPPLAAPEYNLEKYDFVIFASPVWAFKITPALRSYLKGAGAYEDKKAACFLTYGSSAGSRKALAELEEIIRAKKMHLLFSKNLDGNKTKDPAYLAENFKKLLDIIG